MTKSILIYLYASALLAIKAAAFLAAIVTAAWILFEIWLQIIMHAIR